MRIRLLRALDRPLEDVQAAWERVDRFRRPVAALRAVEAKADMAERALEAVSLGLALLDVCAGTNDAEDEP